MGILDMSFNGSFMIDYYFLLFTIVLLTPKCVKCRISSLHSSALMGAEGCGMAVTIILLDLVSFQLGLQV